MNEVLQILTILALLYRCISLSNRVENLERIVRENFYIFKRFEGRFSIFENKQKYINKSLNDRIVYYAARTQKTKQGLSSLRRDIQLSGIFVKDIEKP